MEHREEQRNAGQNTNGVWVPKIGVGQTKKTTYIGDIVDIGELEGIAAANGYCNLVAPQLDEFWFNTGNGSER
jgi:hypothetical protein